MERHVKNVVENTHKVVQLKSDRFGMESSL